MGSWISSRMADAISSALAGHRQDIMARSSDGMPVVPGVAVVIERIDGAVASVSVIP